MSEQKTVTLELSLIEQLQDAIAKATAAATQATGGASAGIAGARTQSNKEIDSGTESVFKTIQQDSDIGVPEAWSANVKRTYDLYQTYDVETQVQNRHHYNTLVTQLQTHLGNLNQLTITNLANNQNQSNLNNTLGIDRGWNINETDLAAKSVALLTDAVLAEVVKKMEEEKNQE